MKRIMSAVAAVLALTAGNSVASGGGHWGYTGEGAPEHWGSLNPAYALCSVGVNQSPINMTDLVESELEPISFNYTGLVTEVVHNGHAIQADYTAGSTMTVNGKIFSLKQFHFHTPSENLINGEQFPMEAHFVHADTDGNLAVIAVMYNIGEENDELKKIWQQMPAEAGQRTGMASQVRADQLMPENKEYYRFNGSLTTPPCTEGVLWMVMKNPVQVSEAQVKQLAKVLKHPNNRPVQPVNARPVLQ
ncbi:MAG: carbonic anhydrase family protein [Candidatus Electrothrix sp. GM3_4]|nr:carbonic anhydrase family protein [Candidatus Electrothrix sp. GM3_4]